MTHPLSLPAMEALIEEYGMIPPGGTVLCAVSGGADSVCLLHALGALRARIPFILRAAHYNHRLRGAESDRDEAFVRAFVSRLGGEGLPPVEVTVGSGDVAGEARRRGRGIEETARAMRYAFLRRAAEEAGAAVIATAHTADDNAETLLLHLIRGSGLQGLTGIAPRRGDLVRPLLTTPRREAEKYLAAWGLHHVEDSSNADDAYARNQVRHHIIPALTALNPRFLEGVTDTIRYLRQDNDYLNAQAAQVCRHARWAEDDLVIEARYIAEAPAAIAPRAARRLLEMLGDGDSDCSAAHLNAIVALCRGEDPSAVAFLPGGKLAQRVYRELLLTTRRDPLPPLEPLVPEQGVTPIPGTGWALRLSRPPWPGLVVRARQTGDEITLPGRPGKTVKKLFIDQKVPRRVRERIPLAADGDGVLALAGFGPNTAHPRYPDTGIAFIQTESTAAGDAGGPEEEG